jgi:hypothetical protein
MKTNFLHKKGWYPHTINIETKDNRFKYVITVSLYYSIGTVVQVKCVLIVNQWF